MCHFLVCGWLCVATLFVKHRTLLIMSSLDIEMTDTNLQNLIRTSRMTLHMACGTQTGTLMVCGLSSHTAGISLEVDGNIVLDVCWLWPVNDVQHNNLAELDAILRSINLILQWGCISSWALHVCTAHLQSQNTN